MTPALTKEATGGMDRAVRLGLLVLLSAMVGVLLTLGFWLEGPGAGVSARAHNGIDPQIVGIEEKR
jgi:hypothetical protein